MPPRTLWGESGSIQLADGSSATRSAVPGGRNPAPAHGETYTSDQRRSRKGGNTLTHSSYG